MKRLFTISFFICIMGSLVSAQWNTVLATGDNSDNGTGYQTISVGVVDTTMFVALVDRPTGIVYTPYDDVNIIHDSSTCCYLVGYKNATTNTGRLGTYPYGGAATAGVYSKWFSGFDEVYLFRAYKIATTPDSLIYVANNDPDHNILVFRITADTIETTDYRMPTGTKDIQGLAVDKNGYVYVSEIIGDETDTKEVKIYKGLKDATTTWGAETHGDNPVATIDLPAGVYRGLTVSDDGSMVFVSCMSTQSVLKFTGTPATGYTLSPSFNFQLTAADSIPESYNDTTQLWDMGKPLGMGYMSTNNLLFVAAARWWGNTILAHNDKSGYTYSKIFILNPVNGSRLDSIDIAKYYYALTGGYATQLFDSANGQYASGYTSTYDVAFDENKDLYVQSFYSWTVEKWHYTGELPFVDLGLGVRQQSSAVPDGFALSQNYPNPFNPTTTINFSVPVKGNVVLKVYDMLGKEVSTLVSGEMGQGTYTASFDAQKLSSGIYFYTLRAGSYSETKKMILTK
jgi:hypothetical protein